MQCDLWEPSGRSRSATARRAAARWSSACWATRASIAGALIFSKEAPDVLWGLRRCVWRLGALPERLVWDREGCCTPAAAGRPRRSPPSAASCRSAGVILDARDAQAKGVSSSGCTGSWRPTSSRAGRSRTSSTSRTSWTAGAENASTPRLHRTIRGSPGRAAGRGAGAAAAPGRVPDTDRRWCSGFRQQPYRARRSQRLLARPALRRASRRGPGLTG